MAMSTPTVTNRKTSDFLLLHPQASSNVPPSANLVSGFHDVQHVGVLNRQNGGYSDIWYCDQDNAINIDLIS